MTVHYYSLRRLSPFEGMLQVVEVEDSTAFSFDGVRWHIRCRNESGHFRMVGVWSEQTHTSIGRCRDAEVLENALHNRPRLPFPQEDPFELWLLDKANSQPLALLSGRHQQMGLSMPNDLNWIAFSTEENRFVSASLKAVDAARPRGAHPPPHRSVLERQVNQAARPLAAAQWFQRHPDGSGTGLQGVRLSEDLLGRRLVESDFPELLVSEEWAEASKRFLVEEYHEWNAARLLTLQRLSPSTRLRLEHAACRQPETLPEVYRLIPEFIDLDAIKTAMVAARLLAAT